MKLGGHWSDNKILCLSAAISLVLHLAFLFVGSRTHYPIFILIYSLLFGLYLIQIKKLHNVQGALLWIFLGIALLFRMIHLGYEPFLSTDIYRYYWDGKVQSLGINPFRYAPDANALVDHRDAYWNFINFKSMPTIYPPFAQGFFYLCYLLKASPLSLRISFVLVEIGLCLLLFRYSKTLCLPTSVMLIYALNPLPIFEFAGSGHLDILGMFWQWIALLALAIGRPWLPQIGLALTFLTKFIGVIIAPLFVRRSASCRRPWLFLGIIGFSYLLYLSAGTKVLGNFFTYLKDWKWNGSIYYLFLYCFGFKASLGRIICLLLWLGVIALIAWRESDVLRGAAVIVISWICFSTTVHPWYVLWLLPFACFIRLPSVIWLTFAVGMTYFGNLGGLSGKDWKESICIVVMEYSVFYFLLVCDLVRMYFLRPPHGKPLISERDGQDLQSIL